MTLHFQKNKRVNHIFLRLLVDSKLPVGFMTRGSFVQKISESCASKKLTLAQGILRCTEQRHIP